MEEVKQTNISSYFYNLKRTSSDLGIDTKADFFSNSSFKREKKSEIVKMGDCSNYTLNKFFQFSKEEACLSEIKSGLKKLEINSKAKSNNISNFSSNITNNLVPTDIKSYFTKPEGRTSIAALLNVNDSEMASDKNEIEIINEDHKVFSLDNFEYSDSKRQVKKFIPDNSVKAEGLKINGNSMFCKNVKYEDVKITHWVKYTTYSDLNGINENIFQNILKYLNFRELTQTSIVNKTFQNFYKNTLTSYNYFNPLDTSKIGTKKEFSEMLKKGRNLKHIQTLNEIIKNDFGGDRQGPESFFIKVILIMTLSSVEDLKYKGTLLDSFKIKPRKADCNTVNNFISNDSVAKICSSSRFTLRDLSLRGCYKLTNRVATHGIYLCAFLERLELSFNNQIDDEAIHSVCQNCPNLKVLSLSNIKLLTEKSVRSIASLHRLEGLDLSENTLIKGDSLVSLQNCVKINRLILNGIKLTDNDFIFTDYLNELETLSIANVRTVTEDCLLSIAKNCTKLVNLKIDKNKSFTEQAIFEIVNKIKSLRIIISEPDLLSLRVKKLLDSRFIRN